MTIDKSQSAMGLRYKSKETGATICKGGNYIATWESFSQFGGWLPPGPGFPLCTPSRTDYEVSDDGHIIRLGSGADCQLDEVRYPAEGLEWFHPETGVAKCKGPGSISGRFGNRLHVEWADTTRNRELGLFVSEGVGSTTEDVEREAAAMIRLNDMVDWERVGRETGWDARWIEVDYSGFLDTLKDACIPKDVAVNYDMSTRRITFSEAKPAPLVIDDPRAHADWEQAGFEVEEPDPYEWWTVVEAWLVGDVQRSPAAPGDGWGLFDRGVDEPDEVNGDGAKCWLHDFGGRRGVLYRWFEYRRLKGVDRRERYEWADQVAKWL